MSTQNGQLRAMREASGLEGLGIQLGVQPPGGQQVANLSEKQKRVYILATVTGIEGQKARVKTIIDSRNTLDTRVAISDRFRKKMGLQFVSLKKSIVSIANKQSKLIQL